MFGRAAITLGIGPHSSFCYFLVVCTCFSAQFITIHLVVQKLVVAGNNKPSVGRMPREGVAGRRADCLTAEALLRILGCTGSVSLAVDDLLFQLFMHSRCCVCLHIPLL